MTANLVGFCRQCGITIRGETYYVREKEGLLCKSCGYRASGKPGSGGGSWAAPPAYTEPGTGTCPRCQEDVPLRKPHQCGKDAIVLDIIEWEPGRDRLVAVRYEP